MTKDAYRQLVWIAIAFVALAWIAYGWMAVTGTSFSTRFSDHGRNVGAKQVRSARDLAIMGTVVCTILVIAGGGLRKKS